LYNYNIKQANHTAFTAEYPLTFKPAAAAPTVKRNLKLKYSKTKAHYNIGQLK